MRKTEKRDTHVKETLYFAQPGPANTCAVVRAVRDAVQDLGISHVVVASCRGSTALEFSEALADLAVALTVVTCMCGHDGEDTTRMSESTKKELASKGAQVVQASHALSGVGRGIMRKFGGINQIELVAYVLRLLGEGFKAAVEVAVMAADAGYVPTDRDIIAVGGTGRGADCAVVIKAAHTNNFFDVHIREIIAKPR